MVVVLFAGTALFAVATSVVSLLWPCSAESSTGASDAVATPVWVLVLNGGETTGDRSRAAAATGVTARGEDPLMEDSAPPAPPGSGAPTA